MVLLHLNMCLMMVSVTLVQMATQCHRQYQVRVPRIQEWNHRPIRCLLINSHLRMEWVAIQEWVDNQTEECRRIRGSRRLMLRHRMLNHHRNNSHHLRDNPHHKVNQHHKEEEADSHSSHHLRVMAAEEYV